ncbi:hypothetical protein AA101099_1562 [Neoasaia chiangmaiensis NBRC 101099]|nr:hypothetical protein AA101099_1562 [Neoasaia chiangmaiensis NBRC 101099]GEN15520.1 hypothetical protein NCH01_19510 [Neoasaia chiangmaiensis]
MIGEALVAFGSRKSVPVTTMFSEPDRTGAASVGTVCETTLAFRLAAVPAGATGAAATGVVVVVRVVARVFFACAL